MEGGKEGIAHDQMEQETGETVELKPVKQGRERGKEGGKDTSLVRDKKADETVDDKLMKNKR